MASRGCTSRAASRDPQVFRVPWTVIVGTLAAAMHRLKLRLALRGSIGVPCRVVNATCLDPRLAGAGTVSVLLSLTDLERRDTQPGQAQGCF